LKIISPEEDLSSPAKIERRVLLPHPLLPTIAINSPSLIFRDISLIASISPSLV